VVILSGAKDLLSARQKQILCFAQDDIDWKRFLSMVD